MKKCETYEEKSEKTCEKVLNIEKNVFNFYIGYNLIIFSAAFIYFYNRLKSQKFSLSIKKFQYFKNKYLDYSIPLIQANIFVALFFIFDRWFLQYSYGDLEQGYFGIAFRLSLVITLIATSFYPIFRQNISVYLEPGSNMLGPNNRHSLAPACWNHS